MFITIVAHYISSSLFSCLVSTPYSSIVLYHKTTLQEGIVIKPGMMVSF